jgi:creatinine amidohydrolase
MDFAGSLTFHANTYIQVLSEMCEGIARHGFRRLLLLNGHGGNISLASAAVTEFRHHHRGVAVATASYWDLAADEINHWLRSRRGGICHACELETALVLALHESLVDLDQAAPNMVVRTSKFISDDLLGGSSVFAPADIAEISSTGTIGDPTLASRERGEEILRLIVSAVGSFLVEFREWDLERPAAAPDLNLTSYQSAEGTGPQAAGSLQSTRTSLPQQGDRAK